MRPLELEVVIKIERALGHKIHLLPDGVLTRAQLQPAVALLSQPAAKVFGTQRGAGARFGNKKCLAHANEVFGKSWGSPLAGLKGICTAWAAGSIVNGKRERAKKEKWPSTKTVTRSEWVAWIKAHPHHGLDSSLPWKNKDIRAAVKKGKARQKTGRQANKEAETFVHARPPWEWMKPEK